MPFKPIVGNKQKYFSKSPPLMSPQPKCPGEGQQLTLGSEDPCPAPSQQPVCPSGYWGAAILSVPPSAHKCAHQEWQPQVLEAGIQRVGQAPDSLPIFE